MLGESTEVFRTIALKNHSVDYPGTETPQKARRSLPKYLREEKKEEKEKLDGRSREVDIRKDGETVTLQEQGGSSR